MRDLYASQWFRITALLWVVGFFVVFMPAHRRGVVTLPGADHAVAGEDGEPVAAACPLCTTAAADGEPLPADAPVNCVVCHLKAGLDVPPNIILAPAFIDELDFLLADITPHPSPLFASQTTLHGRAPPYSG
ncbi:MAG: hypothetical protein AAF333_07435 [Planctomycetota bacterium]